MSACTNLAVDNMHASFGPNRRRIAHACADSKISCCHRPWVYPADAGSSGCASSLAPAAERMRPGAGMAAPAGATNNPLFRFGVDLDGVDAQTGRTALHSAAMFADADKVRLPVAQAGAQPARVQPNNLAIDNSVNWLLK